MALRNLMRNRRRTLLTLAALAVGVTSVVCVRGFLNGLQNSLILGIAEGSIGAVLVHKKGYLQSVEASPLTPNMELNGAFLERLMKVDGVRAVAPRISFGGMVSVGDETIFSIISGVDPAAELVVCPRRRDSLVTGAWLTEGSSDALMGMEIAKSLSAKEGSVAAVLTGDVEGVMNAVEVTVRGTVAAAAQAERKLLIMPLGKAQELLRMEGRITEIAVGVKRVEQVEQVRDRLSALLGDDYEVSTWKDMAPLIRDAQEGQNTALNLITIIFLFIMLMGIANTLLMSVLERVREIGTMMAVGARRRQVLLIFLLEALMLGALGATVGALMGFTVVGVLGIHGVVLTTPGASLPQHITPMIGPWFLLRMVALAAGGSAVAAFYPAYKASRLRPVEALGAV